MRKMPSKLMMATILTKAFQCDDSYVILILFVLSLKFLHIYSNSFEIMKKLLQNKRFSSGNEIHFEIIIQLVMF